MIKIVWKRLTPIKLWAISGEWNITIKYSNPFVNCQTKFKTFLEFSFF